MERGSAVFRCHDVCRRCTWARDVMLVGAHLLLHAHVSEPRPIDQNWHPCVLTPVLEKLPLIPKPLIVKLWYLKTGKNIELTTT